MSPPIPMGPSFLPAGGSNKRPNTGPLTFAPLLPAKFGGASSPSAHTPRVRPSGATTGSSSTTALCIQCNTKPRYNDGTKTHSFCGKGCAATHKVKQGSTVKHHNQCKAPGCTKPPRHSSDYCSQVHKTLSENLCLKCLQAPKMANSSFCSQTCVDKAKKDAPTILKVPLGHSTFKSVTAQFEASWRHPGSPCPTVRRVYKIVTQAGKVAAYKLYRASVESQRHFLSRGRSAGNENRRWHGTDRNCNLGDKGHMRFCSSPTCSLCLVIQNSFDISSFGKKTGWGRFGKGIYTSSTSSKSNDYSHNDCKSHLKAILLNKVVVGKGCKLLQDDRTLTSPPKGYDSVIGEAGGSLNYDELVVYRNDAIMPSYLVMYDKP